MNRTWVVRILISALVVALGVLIARNSYWEDTEVDTPMKGEALKNPYYALENFVHVLGIKTQIASTLQRPPLRTGVLFVGNSRMDLLRRRIESLEPWVEDGGHLVVGGMTMWTDKALQSWSGVSPDTHDVRKTEKSKTKPEGEEEGDDEEDGEVDLPLIAHGEKCEQLAVATNSLPTGERLQLCGMPDVLAFKSRQPTLWSASNAHGMQSLRLSIGKGTLTILPRAPVVDNVFFRQGDHAKLILAASGLQRGDTAWLYQPSRTEKLLPMLWRIAAPGIIVLLIATLLIVIRQIPRFGTPLPDPMPWRRSLAEQIRANAAFAWRARNLTALRRAASRALDETGSRLVASYKRISTQQRADILASAAGIDRDALAAAMTEDAAGEPRVQRSAIALLQSTRRSLLQRVKKTRKSA